MVPNTHVAFDLFMNESMDLPWDIWGEIVCTLATSECARLALVSTYFRCFVWPHITTVAVNSSSVNSVFCQLVRYGYTRLSALCLDDCVPPDTHDTHIILDQLTSFEWNLIHLCPGQVYGFGTTLRTNTERRWDILSHTTWPSHSDTSGHCYCDYCDDRVQDIMDTATRCRWHLHLNPRRLQSLKIHVDSADCVCARSIIMHIMFTPSAGAPLQFPQLGTLDLCFGSDNVCAHCDWFFKKDRSRQRTEENKQAYSQRAIDNGMLHLRGIYFGLANMPLLRLLRIGGSYWILTHLIEYISKVQQKVPQRIRVELHNIHIMYMWDYWRRDDEEDQPAFSIWANAFCVYDSNKANPVVVCEKVQQWLHDNFRLSSDQVFLRKRKTSPPTGLVNAITKKFQQNHKNKTKEDGHCEAEDDDNHRKQDDFQN